MCVARLSVRAYQAEDDYACVLPTEHKEMRELLAREYPLPESVTKILLEYTDPINWLLCYKMPPQRPKLLKTQALSARADAILSRWHTHCHALPLQLEKLLPSEVTRIVLDYSLLPFHLAPKLEDRLAQIGSLCMSDENVECIQLLSQAPDKNLIPVIQRLFLRHVQDVLQGTFDEDHYLVIFTKFQNSIRNGRRNPEATPLLPTRARISRTDLHELPLEKLTTLLHFRGGYFHQHVMHQTNEESRLYLDLTFLSHNMRETYTLHADTSSNSSSPDGFIPKCSFRIENVESVFQSAVDNHDFSTLHYFLQHPQLTPNKRIQLAQSIQTLPLHPNDSKDQEREENAKLVTALLNETLQKRAQQANDEKCCIS